MQKHFNLILQICIFCFKKDYLTRQRIDGEIGQLRDNVHRILSEQQEEFAQAFGLHDHDKNSSSEVCHTHPATRWHGAKTGEVIDPSRTITCFFLMESAILLTFSIPGMCWWDDKCTCKTCKTIVFHCQIRKFVRFLLPSSSWFLKLTRSQFTTTAATKTSEFCVLENEKQRLLHAIFILVHFAVVLVQSTTWDDLFCNCVHDVGKVTTNFHFFFSNMQNRWYNFNSRIIRTHFANTRLHFQITF